MVCVRTSNQMHTTVPSKTGFGDYSLESSWEVVPHHILTICYAGGCENGTLTRVTQNHVDFTDINNDTIHLMRFHPSTATANAAAAAQQQPPRQQRNATMLYQEGQSQADLQNYTGAQSLYQKALTINPRDVHVLSDMGRVLFNLKNTRMPSSIWIKR